MRPIPRPLSPWLAAACTLVAACSLHDVQRDPMPPGAVPDRWAAATPDGAALPERWWSALGDAQLDQLIDETLTGNLPLRAAWARVRQARSLVRQAGAARWPQLDATLSASRTRNRFEIGEGMVFTPTVDSFQLSVAAGYEVDLWKRVGHDHAAAELDALAVRDDAEAMAMSLTSEVAEVWFDVVHVKALHQLLLEQQRINETYLELTQLRFSQSLATALDVYQQRQQLLQTRTSIEAGDAALRLAAARLALLTGGAPGDRRWIEAAPTALPEPPPLPAAGVPADLLVNRPDVRAATRRAQAADHRIGAALARRLPGLRIGGTGGFNSGAILDLFKGGVFSVFGQITQAVIDGGARAAAVEQARDLFDERRLQLAYVLQTAVAEIESAMNQETNRRIEIATLEERLILAGATLEEARAIYAGGHVDYLVVLTALSTQQALEIQVLAARRALLSARIRVYRALGGTWTRELSVPGRIGAAPTRPTDRERN